MIAEQSVYIAQSPARVYAFLVDQDSWASLDPSVLDISPRGLVSKGMTGTMTRRVAGMRVTDGFTVTELDPDSRLEMRLTGAGYAVTETISLEATPDGTRATVVDVVEPTSTFGRLFVALSGPFIPAGSSHSIRAPEVRHGARFVTRGPDVTGEGLARPARLELTAFRSAT